MRAATAKRTSVVRAAMAATIGRGLGRYPSADPWCSETVTARQPSRSAHSTMSSEAP